MDRAQEEAVQHITALYVAELHAGHHPRLSDYLSRYPQFADAITDFVTYYHVMEANIPEERDVLSPLSQASRAALDEAWKRVLLSENMAKNVLTSLQKAANNVGKSFSQLAVEIDLSLDILKKLDQDSIDAATVPLEVFRRLAIALQQPQARVKLYLGRVERKQLVQGVAEESASYSVGRQPKSNIQTQSFQEAVEQSMHLSYEQKGAWRSILEKEGLL